MAKNHIFSAIIFRSGWIRKNVRYDIDCCVSKDGAMRVGYTRMTKMITLANYKSYPAKKAFTNEAAKVSEKLNFIKCIFNLAGGSLDRKAKTFLQKKSRAPMESRE
jgi:hypothetical protein